MGSRARLGVVLAEPPLGQRVRPPGSQQHAVTVLRGRAPAAQAPRPRSHGAQTVCTGLSGLNYMLVIKRALTHEVAYGSLLQDRRRTLHARIVEASEALYADRLDEQIERLAHHALRGSVWEKALAYCREAGGRAIGRSAGREAVGYLEGAL